jgi:hypothetical protein
MATTTQETHDALRSLIQKVTTMVADLQMINDEQQDLIYTIEVMANIRSVSVPPSPPLQPSVLLELPPPPLPAEAVAPTDLPPKLLPTQPSVQPYALPSAAVTPAPVMPAGAASLGFAPMSSPLPQSLGLWKQLSAASALISAMPAPPLAYRFPRCNHYWRLLPLGFAALSRKEIRIIPSCFHGNQEGYLHTSRLEATRNMLLMQLSMQIKKQFVLKISRANKGMHACIYMGAACTPSACCFSVIETNMHVSLFAWDPGEEGHTPTVPRLQRRAVVHIPQPEVCSVFDCQK